MAISTQVSLDQLPTELLMAIIVYLDPASLKSISQANWRLRNASIPRLFQSVPVYFTASSFESLKQLIASPIAKVVRTLECRASALLDEDVTNEKTFRKYIYTFDQYFNDQSKGLWEAPEGDMPYAEIQPRLSRLRTDQTELLTSKLELPILVTALQKLPSLNRLVVNFQTVDHPHKAFTKLIQRCGENEEEQFERLLTVCLRAISLGARNHSITTLECSNRYSMPIDINQHSLIQEALTKIKELHIRHHSYLFEYVADYIDMPSLECLKVTALYVELESLERLCNKTKHTLSALHINGRLSYKNKTSNFFEKNGRPAIPVITLLYTIGKGSFFREVTVCPARGPNADPEVYEAFETLLLGRIPTGYESIIREIQQKDTEAL